MGYSRFAVNSLGMEQYIKEILTNPDVVIRQSFFSPNPGSGIDILHIIHESYKDAVKREKDELNKLEKIAKQIVDKDKEYPDLKNQMQRKIHLLKKYGVPSVNANLVMELVNLKLKHIQT